MYSCFTSGYKLGSVYLIHRGCTAEKYVVCCGTFHLHIHIALSFYSIALLYMENGKVSILAGGGEPIAAVVFGVLFFSEIPTILILIGLVITIIALSFLCMPLDRATIYIRYYRIQLCKIRYKTDF